MGEKMRLISRLPSPRPEEALKFVFLLLLINPRRVVIGGDGGFP